MRILLNLPFGGLTKEAGILHLLASHISDGSTQVSQVRCNGMFALCDRDSESGWTRRLHACSNCAADQKGFAAWAGIESLDLSPFISSAEIVDTKRLIAAMSETALLKAEFSGLNLSEIALGSFKSRFGHSTAPDMKNKQHEIFMRKLVLSAMRACMAVKRLHVKHQPDLVLASGGEDFISRSWVMQSKASRCPVAVFKTDLASRCVKISHSEQREPFICDLLLQGVEGFRPDKSTWPREIVGLLEDIRRYLGVSVGQLSMPLAL